MEPRIQYAKTKDGVNDLSSDQVAALMHEYDGLRHDHTTQAGTMTTLGGIGITIVAAIYGFLAQTERLELALVIPAMVFVLGTQMLRMQVNTRYLGLHLQAIERRVNASIGEGTLTWEAVHNFGYGVPSSRDDGWARLLRSEPVNKIANAFLILIFATALLIALSLGTAFIVTLDLPLAWRTILSVIFVGVYSAWGYWLAWLTLVRSRRFLSEAENAYLTQYAATGAKQ